MVFSGGPASAIVAQRKKIIDSFLKHGATRYQDAKTREDLGIRNNFIFKKLLRQGMIRQALGDHFYLDIDQYKQDKDSRKLRFIILLIGGALALIAIGLYQLFSK